MLLLCIRIINAKHSADTQVQHDSRITIHFQPIFPLTHLYIIKLPISYSSRANICTNAGNGCGILHVELLQRVVRIRVASILNHANPSSAICGSYMLYNSSFLVNNNVDFAIMECAVAVVVVCSKSVGYI